MAIPTVRSCLTRPPPAPPSEIDTLPECTAGERAGEGSCPSLTPGQADALERWAAAQSSYAELAWALCGPAVGGTP